MLKNRVRGCVKKYWMADNPIAIALATKVMKQKKNLKSVNYKLTI